MNYGLPAVATAEFSSLSVQTTKNIDFAWGVKIPLRDGVQLNATIYRPRQAEPVPTILALTPYPAHWLHPEACYCAQHGYAFAVVDCRGRGNSAGVFEPFVNDGRDGYDSVEWLAVQPWCDGSVTMWGSSYLGFNQWMALKEFPPHLKAIAPRASAYATVDFPMHKNIFYPYAMQWLTLTSGATTNVDLFSDAAFWIAPFRELYLNHLPYQELDRIVGNTSTHFQTWIQHPIPDVYWDRLALTPPEYQRINIPILTITGYYDGDQSGAMHYYRQHMAFGSREGCSQHYLIIGPWEHFGVYRPYQEFGGLKFGDACLLDLNKLHKEWYDWTLKSGPRPEFLQKRVAYYLMGADEWKYADTLEAIAATSQRLYLNSTAGQANDVFHSGRLETTLPDHAEPDHYVYDPLDVRPGELEREENKNYLTDQRYALNLFGNGVVYHSAPFTATIDIAGYLKFVVWLMLDVPDTDFQVTISAILPDGGHILLTQDLLRARYRESLRQEQLVRPGEIVGYVFDGFPFFAQRMIAGSRLRLLLRCPNSIYLQKNYNSGGVVAAESAPDARLAHVTIYHDAEHPSFLELPLMQ